MGNKFVLKSLKHKEKNFVFDSKEPDPPQEDYKVVILGSLNTGKSTIFKQISNEIGSKSYSIDEKRFFKKLILQNILSSMFQLNLYLNDNLCEYNDKNLETDLSKLNDILAKENYCSIEKNFQDFLPIAKRFFEESIVQKNQTSKFFQPIFLKRGFEYFYCNNYLPSNDDLLYTKSNINILKKFDFFFNKKNVKLFDVNGGKGERKKWIHIFDEVNLLIFVTSISSVFENDVQSCTNSLIEDLNLFDGIVNSKFFVDTKIVLLFTNIDSFSEKLQNFNLNQIFDDFHSQDPHKASSFLKSKFLEKIEDYDQHRVKTFFLSSFNNAHEFLFQQKCKKNRFKN
eukprot:gene6725-10890_t